MSFAPPYPDPATFIANEVETVRFLADNTYVGEYPSFSSAARSSYAQYNGGLRRFEFVSSLEIFHESLPGGTKLRKKARPDSPKSNCRLILASLIETNEKGDFANVSYVLAVCRLYPGKDHTSILRKFHFDFAPESSEADRLPHPIYHLQYCGEMFAGMQKMGYSSQQLKQLHNKVREPRILFWPMSLALLIDISIREFSNSTLKKFRDSPEWRAIVRRNESEILKPFYDECSRIAGDLTKNRGLLAEQFYLR